MSTNGAHVSFTNREVILAFSHDRGVMKSNGYGEYFFRGTTDNRFCCCSPDLERKLIDLGIRAGERVSIRKVTRNRIATWEVKRLDAPVATGPQPVKRFPHNGKVVTPSLPAEKYAQPAAEIASAVPDVSWEDLPSEPAPAAQSVAGETPAPEKAVQQTAGSQLITSGEPSLLGRCLCEALDACKIAQEHAAKIGLPVVFGPDQIEAMGVSIFIARTRDGSVVERKPAGRVNGSVHGYTNGVAQ